MVPATRTRKLLPERVLGRIVSALALAVLSPLLAIAGIAIKVSSRGTVLYRARRSARGGGEFTMFKFRTMHQAPVAAAERITANRDPRIFPTGRWLRRLKIDELPQLANVVMGQMAIVGPRPEDPSIVKDHYTPLMRRTLDVLPGLTSPGSLSYYADEAGLPDSPEAAELEYLENVLARKIALDLVYVENRTWRYDAQLVVRTLAAIVGAHGASAARRQWEAGLAQRYLARLRAEQPDRPHAAESAPAPSAESPE